MKKLFYIAFCALVLASAISCGNTTDDNTRDSVDSLNELSCRLLYVSADSSENVANMAIRMSDGYDDGRYEAMCNVAQARIMKMDYDSARTILLDVRSSTDNALLKFLADSRLMKICQLFAANKEFYEYRTDAEMRIERICEDAAFMNRHQTLMWKVTNCLYNLTLKYHYHNLRYTEEMEMADELCRDWYRSLDSDTTMLERLFQKHTYEFWKNYGNLYCTSRELVRIADTLSLAGRHQNALDTLGLALKYLNKMTGLKTDAEKLRMFDLMDVDTLSKEMRLIEDPNVMTIPELMASVREELSIVYGAMGMKEASDYNRNIYLDILDATCQDLSLNERQERLEHEDNMLDIMLVSLLLFIVFVVITIFVISRKVGERSNIRAERMSRLLDLCNKMTSAMPLEATGQEDIEDDIHCAVDKDVRDLFPKVEGDWVEFDPDKLEKFDKEMLNVLQVLYHWIMENGQVFISMTTEKERVEGERYVHEKRIEGNKRQYIDKSTSVSIVNGITPFLDRAIREVQKLKATGDPANSKEVTERLEYVKELVEKIEAFNEVLGHWVKIRQGAVNLNIENFPLQPMFDTLAKGRTLFDAKNISLQLPDSSEAVVKADSALTLFMMNTLIDNARKYTPEGGCVSVSAEVKDDYVEVRVEDTGNGLTPEDCEVLNNSKVYDSSKIGVDNDNDGMIRKNKGFGFGLMNCRGIIEKYRKTNAIFSVCSFGVESTVGKGSCFYFRLPKGVVRNLMLAVMFVLPGFSAFADEIHNHAECTDDYHCTADSVCPDIEKAIQFYEDMFSCNVFRDFDMALESADSAIYYLNRHYLQKDPGGTLLMKLESDNDDMPELLLQKIGFETDYQLIADIRNEVAIAALALNKRSLYKYNNEIFNRLYKQLSDNHNLEEYCNSIQQSTLNKQLVLTLVLFLFLILLLAYSLMYYRHNLLYIFNMRQLLIYIKRLFGSSGDNINTELFKSVNDVKLVDAVGVAKIDVDSSDESLVFSFEGDAEYRIVLEQFMTLSYKKKEKVDNAHEKVIVYPLEVNMDGEKKCIGALGIVLHDSNISKNDELSLRLIAEFYAMHSYFCSTLVDEEKAELELKMDEMRRIEQEDSRIHIQNMVLDNYLSTIKHETMYYPGRIRQIAEAALNDPDAHRLHDLAEITTYYKEVFTLLSSGASKQLERRVFKRENVRVAELADYARRTFDKRNRKAMLPISFDISDNAPGAVIMTDRIIAHYMIDTLLVASFEDENRGEISLSFDNSDKFIRLCFTDSRLEYSDDERSEIFYADSVKYDSNTGILHGSHFLLLKQMVREHDEYSGHKGCRIFAEKAEEGTRIVILL